MIYRLLLASLCVVLFSVNADARQRHARTYIADPNCNVTMPCEGVTTSARGEMIAKDMGFGAAQKHYTPRPERRSDAISSYSIGRPGRYISGRLICAVNVGSALAERGIKGTGSALALSYLHWGHSAGGPVPGAVIVSARRGGGHVAIVSRVENGVVYAWNATGGQRGWREIAYRHRVLDYRVPG